MSWLPREWKVCQDPCGGWLRWTAPPQKEPAGGSSSEPGSLPRAAQSQWGCYRGRREMGELKGLGLGVPAGLGVSCLPPPRFDD